jgi:hypothetical protein
MTSGVPAERTAPLWKRLVTISASSGAGFALALALIAGGVSWYSSRPPKEWNTTALKATFDRIETQGEKNTISFYYVLENETDRDYQVDSNENIVVGVHLLQEKSLSLVSDQNTLKVDWPLFVPARQRVWFGIHSGLSYDGQAEPSDATPDERKKYRKAVAEFFTKQAGNVDGFFILDKANRYQINFPKGW